MKKKIIAVCLGIIAIVVSVLLYSIIIKMRFNSKMESQLGVPPNMKFRLMQDSTKYFLSKDIPKKRPCIIIYYNTMCGSCQYEAGELVKHQSAFSNTSIIMVSNEPFAQIDSYFKGFKLGSLKNLTMLKSDDDEFYKAFGSRRTPGIFIYNKDLKLVKNYSGETKISALTQWLN
ncbi:peroxiredoxin family protein [Mucilaginibacter ginsenosidivorax]|uniref:Redoxin domain-containing protein n=1 Tax=Mucilaginibacter ginsenosidivorax TaxID=862126 RepID=A0A5B8VXT8_9SPHI|nr:redoxin domain-containing protein [Mucilaginibacter ginsenosidivorax]QEC76153.1 redoxin domain-containing protein [Mucilaginibacter ginsenosidivorax]